MTERVKASGSWQSRFESALREVRRRERQCGKCEVQHFDDANVQNRLEVQANAAEKALIDVLKEVVEFAPHADDPEYWAGAVKKE